MKIIFAVGTALFAIAFAIALATLEPISKPDETVLRWATDPNPARDRQSRQFTAEHPTLRVVPESSDATKLIVQCATGVGPDLMDLSESAMQSMVQAGLLVDLTEIAKTHGFDLSKTYPAIGEALCVDGQQYRFPCNVNVQAVLYNRAIFDDHGVPYPNADWTWDDFVKAGRMILENPSKSGKKHIPVANWSPQEFVADLFATHGVKYFSDDGLTCTLDSPEAIAAFQQYHDLMFVDRLLPTPEQSAATSSQGGWGSGGINWFSSGDAAMIFIGRWFTVQIANFPELREHLGAVRIPRFEGQPSIAATRARGVGINALSPNRDAAVEFMRYLASPEYGALIVRDGDSLPPTPDLAGSGESLINPNMPDAAFHQVFVDAIANAIPQDTSPYVDAAQVSRWILEAISIIENRVATPEQAARSLTAEINKTIQRNIERQPHLRERAKMQSLEPDHSSTDL